MSPQFKHKFVCFTGYGFVDFDSPAAAQKAVTALKSSGVQAQMAKVRVSKLFISSVIQLPLLLAPKFTIHHWVNDPVLFGPYPKCKEPPAQL